MEALRRSKDLQLASAVGLVIELLPAEGTARPNCLCSVSPDTTTKPFSGTLWWNLSWGRVRVDEASLIRLGDHPKNLKL